MPSMREIARQEESLKIFWKLVEAPTEEEEEDQYDPPPADWPIAHVEKAVNSRRGSWWWSCRYRVELPRALLILISSFLRPNRQEYIFYHMRELLTWLEEKERRILIQRIILAD